MPQSLSAVYVHLVYSTKGRRVFFRDKALRQAVHAYIAGVTKRLECPAIIVGGYEEHVHVVARFGRTVTQADWVKELKRVSNLWLKTKGPEWHDFEWQGGYSIFSVSQSNLDSVKRYVSEQEEHHTK